MINIERLRKMKKEHEEAMAPYVNGRARHTGDAGRDDTADYVGRHMDAIRRIDKSIHDIDAGRAAAG